MLALLGTAGTILLAALLGIAILLITAGVSTYFIFRLPVTHPMRGLLTAVLLRIGATVGGATVAAPMATIPGLGEAGDIAILLGTLYFWFTLAIQFANYIKAFRFDPPPAPAEPTPWPAPGPPPSPAQSPTINLTPNGGMWS